MSKLTAILKFATVAIVSMAGVATYDWTVYDWTWVGPVVVALWVVAWSFRLSDPLRQIGFIALVGMLGVAFETCLIQAGIYLPRSLPAGSPVVASPLCPLWEIAIWVALGLTAPTFTPKEWRGYIPLAVGGALIAPLFYLAADAIPGHPLHLKRPLWPTLILIALLWQGLWPGICWLAQSRWYRVRESAK
jgi:hypothetical protein